MRSRHVALTAAVLLAACGDERPPTGPTFRGPSVPNAAVLDGNNAGGNPDFFFLSPLVKDPAGNPDYRDDAFDASRSVTVQICAKPVVDISPKDGLCDSGNEKVKLSGAQIAVSTTDEHYQVNVLTDDPSLLPGMYTVRVLITNVELGHADIQLVDQQQVKNANTGDAIPLADGRTLPLKFRIEDNPLVSADDHGTGSELAYVEQIVPNDNPNATGTVVLSKTPQGIALGGGFFTDGWLAGQNLSQITVVIEEVAVKYPADCHPGSSTSAPYLLQYGKCFRYSTVPVLQPINSAGHQFSQKVTVGFCRELPTTDPQYNALQVYRSKTGEPDAPVAIPVAIYSQYFQLACADDGPHAAVAPSGVWGRMYAGWRGLASGIGRVLGPKPLYAVDLGVGG